MSFKQSNWAEILDSERKMVLQGEQRFGAYYVNAGERASEKGRGVPDAGPNTNWGTIGGESNPVSNS